MTQGQGTSQDRSRRPTCLAPASCRALVAAAIVVALALPSPGAAEPPPAAGPHAEPIHETKEKILGHLALKPGMTIAEIGAGGGWFVFRAAEILGPQGKVYATDIDAEVVTSLRAQLRNINPQSAPVDVRLCRDERDTALDDLPNDHLDVLLMVDSLCFDAHGSRQRNVEYLRGFLRMLRPGGRLVHHMDCRCDVSPEAIADLFTEAGFTPREPRDVSFAAERVDPSLRCDTEIQRKRQAWLGVFEKPDRPSRTPASGDATAR